MRPEDRSTARSGPWRRKSLRALPVIITSAMASPPRRPAPALAAPAANPELLGILVARRILSAEQAERVRRSMKLNNQGAEQAAVALGYANDVQIAQALAAH